MYATINEWVVEVIVFIDSLLYIETFILYFNK